MTLAKNILLFGFFGLALLLHIFGLSSVAPSVFGWFAAPFWVLPALASLGAHDVGWPLFSIERHALLCDLTDLLYQAG